MTAAARPVSSPPTPTFLGIGGQKCGSTWLSDCLAEHPQIVVTSPKELHFFDHPPGKRQSLETYLGYFENPSSGIAVGEFTPSYLVRADPTRIINTLGPVKLIAILRDPVARFVSHYKHLVRSGARMVGQALGPTEVEAITDEHVGLLANGQYARHLSRYVAVFGIEMLHTLILEEAAEAPGEYLPDLFGFLGVDEDFEPGTGGQVVGEGMVPRWPTVERSRRLLARWTAEHAPSVRDIPRRTGLSRIYQSVVGTATEPTLTPAADDWLTQHYAPMVADLEDLLGRPMTTWKRWS